MRLKDYTQQGRDGFLEVDCFIDFDLGDDNSVDISGVYLQKEGIDEIDITPWLSADKLGQARENVLWMLEKEWEAERDKKEAYGDWLYDQRKDDRLTGDL